MTNCLTCKFCELLPSGNGQEAQGACRLNPPQMQMMMTAQGPAPMVMVPMVRVAKDWCSHYVVQLVKPVQGNIRLEK